MKKTLLNVDIFNLGFSFLFYYLVIFSILPIAYVLGLTTEFTNLTARGINLLTGESSAYLLAGFLAFVVGYYVITAKFTNYALAKFLTKSWDPTRTLWITVGVMTAGFAIKGPRIISALAEPSADVSGILMSFLSLNPLHFIALAIAFSQYYFLLQNHDERANFSGLIAWPLFVFEFLGQVLFGAGRMSILTPVLICLITRHYLYERCTKRIIIIGVAAILLIFPIKLYMKDKTNLDQNYFGDQQENSVPHFTSDLTATVTLIIDSTIGRLGQSHIFTAIVERTDDFLYGKGFLDFFRAFNLQTLTSRNILFINDGNDFGKAIGILESRDVITGVGPTQIGDLYLNFGFSGIMVGMCILGMLYRYLFENFVTARSISGVMIYSILWIQIIHGFEDWLSLSYVRHIKILFVLIIIHIVLTTNLSQAKPRWITRKTFTGYVRNLWIMGLKPVSLSFTSLVLVSTAMSQSIGMYDQAFGNLSSFAVYQERMRDIENCEHDHPFIFRNSLPYTYFYNSIMNEHPIRKNGERAYLLGLAEFEKGDYIAARTRFLEGSSHNHPMATYNLGMIYEGAYGVIKDNSKAAMWYAKASKRGVVRAITDLGRLVMEDGDGTDHMAKAFHFFSRAASHEDRRALVWLGYMYETGKHVNTDLSQSVELYLAAVEKGDSLAMVHLARLFESGTGVLANNEKAVALYQRAAHLGEVVAMKRLSALYESGQGLAKSISNSLLWTVKAMEAETIGMRAKFMEQYYSELTKWAFTQLNLNDVLAMRTVGIAYAEGVSVPKSLGQALKWFKEGAKRGDSSSMRNLGIMFEHGLEVTTDPLKAQGWYIAAAEKGDSIAAKNLGRLYERSSNGVPKNLQLAVQWYRTAADAGNNEAMCRLGNLYYRGQSVSQNHKIAEKWFKRSADQGNSVAMNNLGLLYELGRGVKISYETAFHWYERGAQQGNFTAMRNLALLYEKGQGIEESYSQAIQWYRKASRGGDAIARTKLSKLESL